MADPDLSIALDAAGTRSTLRQYAQTFRRAAGETTSRRPFVTLFVAGAASVASMAPFHFWPILLITLPVLLWSLDDVAATGNSAWRSAAWRGWAFGFGYHFAGLYWIGHAFLVQAERFAVLMPFAIVSLTAALGLFIGLAAIVHYAIAARLPPGLLRIVSLALVLMAAEWLRGHILTGFPWNVLGYALTMPQPLMQLAGIFGIYGLTAATVLLLATPLVILAGPSQRPWRTISAVSLAPLALAMAYGSWQLSANPTTFDHDVRFRLVQPSFTQKEKFMAEKRYPIFQRHLAMSVGPSPAAASARRATSSGPAPPGSLRPPTHIIWPEAAVPFLLRRHSAARQEIASTLPDNAQLIVGTFRIDSPPDVPNEAIKRFRVFNSALGIAGDGSISAVYDKIHLVPFGEYLPAQTWLNWLGFENLTRSKGGLAAGSPPRPLMRLPGMPPAEILICYEASFPSEVGQGNERPGVLINLTNDAWFGNGTGPYQHLHQTRVRAVEQGVAMLRSANNGISAVIDGNGRIITQLGLNAVGVIQSSLPKPTLSPVYAKSGRLVEIVVFLALVIVLIVGHLGVSRRIGYSKS